MNTALCLISLLVVLGVLAILFAPALYHRLASKWRALENDGALTVGIHEDGRLSGYHDSAPQTVRFLLAIQGSADNHYAIPTTLLQMPVAVCIDEPAETTDIVGFRTLLNAGETQRMVAAGAIAAGAVVVTNGDGYVKTLPDVAGVYWQVGVAITTATTSGDQLEVQSCIQQIHVADAT
jgi:hypothetical protein